MNKGSYKTKDIYIIKNDINNKVYIGQSVNMKERWFKYKTEAKNRPNNQLITKAMAKYGFEHFWMECLESQVENYDEREQYWIAFYNCRAPYGYNLAEGGQGNAAGVNSISSKIKDLNSLMAIYALLQDNTVTITDIAKQFKVSITTIIDINKGRYYSQPGYTYPLRPFYQNRYSEELLKQIAYSLKYELDKSMQQIANEYDIDISQLSEFNNGKIHKKEWLSYPIRKSKEVKIQELVPSIIQDLQEQKLSQTAIAKKYNISANTVTNINLGKRWANPNLNYPIRSNGQNTNNKDSFIDRATLKEIIDLLQNSSLSINAIAKQYQVSASTIHNINSGKTIKYHLENIQYPIRKK